MGTQTQARRKAIIKELYVSAIGWLWIAGCVAVLYYLYGAVFSDTSWWNVLGAVVATWVFYRVALFYQLEREREPRAVEQTAVRSEPE